MVRNYLKIVIREFYDLFLYKSPRKKKIKYYDFRKKVIESKDFESYFFLSTGRTGTAFFTVLLNNSKKVKVFHSPMNLVCSKSELIEQGKIAYEKYTELGSYDVLLNEVFSQVFLAAREELLYKTFLHDKIYVETNNRITFLAPAIKYLLPNAKFIHLYRHPGEFIRSGIRRNYYYSTSEHELGRIKPLKGNPYFEIWDKMDIIEKIAWLWNETNAFIDEFLSTLPKEDYLKFNFNELSIESVMKLLSFLKISDIKEKTIAKLITKPINVQKKGSFPKYTEWSEEDKNKARKICGKLANKYNYKL